MKTLVMHASRSLIALLVGTVAFFALWVVALKPGSSSSGPNASTQGLGRYQTALNKAHQAVQTSTAAAAAAAGSPPPATSTSGSPAAAAPSAVNTASRTSSRSRAVPHAAARAHHRAGAARHHRRAATAADRFATVEHAIKAHKVVAILFYNPSGADDQAVKQELAAVPLHHGKVVKLTIPLSEIANYTAVTQQVPVNFSPTLVLIAPNGKAGEIVGFTDSFEIAQRVKDALAAK
jgi:hypothetical protein